MKVLQHNLNSETLDFLEDHTSYAASQHDGFAVTKVKLKSGDVLEVAYNDCGGFAYRFNGKEVTRAEVDPNTPYDGPCF